MEDDHLDEPRGSFNTLARAVSDPFGLRDLSNVASVNE